MKQISWKCLPTPIPVNSSVLCWLALDHWKAPGWLYGACGVLLGVIWVAWIYGLFAYETVDIFEKDGR